MPARLKISLSELEFKKLRELSQNPQVPERTRKRAEVLCLSARGWTVAQIAEWMNWAANTAHLKPSDVDTKRRGRAVGCSKKWEKKNMARSR